MILQGQIADIIDSQGLTFWKKGKGTDREIVPKLPIIDGFALIITGVRRCGKSTVMLQILAEQDKNALFLNFEDPRLAGFELADFNRLSKEIEKRKVKTLCFDEIQLINNWEMFVRSKLDEGYKVFITGSNATMLSKELGTKLTGRHISVELFPFSYKEYLNNKKIENSEKALNAYLKIGGFPEYVKTGFGIILMQLLNDILSRDIAVRYAIRDYNSLRQLAVYLISNIGKPVSATSLKNLFQIKAASTILEYFSYFENSYLLQFLPIFSYSVKAQIRNPKKVYVIDLGLFTENSIIFTEESGRRLENLVYLFLRRKSEELYYFKGKKECDFVIMDRGQLKELVQVTYQLTDFNMEREIMGLEEAMAYFKVDSGTIVTFNQKDTFNRNNNTIRVIPVSEYLLD